MPYHTIRTLPINKEGKMSISTKIRKVSIFTITVAIVTLSVITSVPTLIGKILAMVATVLVLGGFAALIYSNKIEQFFK